MKIQIAKTIFLLNLSTMKQILDILAFKFGKKSEDYRFLKKEIMDLFYKKLKKLFKDLVELKILVRCPCRANLRKGYSDCEFCGGSGYRNRLRD